MTTGAEDRLLASIAYSPLFYFSPRSQQQRWSLRGNDFNLSGRAGRASVTDNAESDNAESECAAGPCPSRSRTRVAEPAAESAGSGPLQT